MKLTQKQQDYIIQAFKTKFTPPTCPICKKNEFRLQDEVYCFPEWPLNISRSQLFPCILLWCVNCGYTIPINALIIGVMDITGGEVKNG